MAWGKKQPKGKKSRSPGRDSSTQYWIGGARLDHPVERAKDAVKDRAATGREKRALASLEAAASANPTSRNRRAVAKYKKDHGL